MHVYRVIAGQKFWASVASSTIFDAGGAGKTISPSRIGMCTLLPRCRQGCQAEDLKFDAGGAGKTISDTIGLYMFLPRFGEAAS